MSTNLLTVMPPTLNTNPLFTHYLVMSFQGPVTDLVRFALVALSSESLQSR